MRLENPNTTTNNLAQIGFYTSDGSASTDGARFGAIFTSHSAGAVSGALQFQTRNAGTIAERMRIDSSGNVGIGVSNPTAKLHIGGTAGVDGIKFPDGTTQTTAPVELVPGDEIWGRNRGAGQRSWYCMHA